MDINEELNSIIFKYNLDRCYPHYRNMCEAEKILRDIIREIISNNSTAIFVGNDTTGIDFIKNISRDYDKIEFFHYSRSVQISPQFETVEWNKYERVYLISFYAAEYVERWFRCRNIRCQWIYDIFERMGVFCQREFFAFGKEDLWGLIATNERHGQRKGWTESIQCELYCQQSKYDSTDDLQIKNIALEKCLFLTLYMKDFIEAEKYVQLLSKYDNKFTDMWQEVQGLLNTVKKTINTRRGGGKMILSYIGLIISLMEMNVLCHIYNALCRIL